MQGRFNKRLKWFFRRGLLSGFCHLRCFGLPVVVIDRSVYWTLLPYRKLFWGFLKKRTILLQLDDIVSWKWGSLDKTTENYNFKQLQSVTYGVCDTFQVLPWELESVNNAERQMVTDHYTNAFLTFYKALVYAKKRLRLRKVFYAQGYMPGADACRQFSLRTGVKRLAVENVADKNKILWENITGISVNKTLAKNFYEGYRGVFSADILKAHLGRKVAGIRENKLAEHQAGKAKTLENGYILFLGQVYTDTSVIFSARKGWAPLDILVALADNSILMGYDLYIKLHPKELFAKSSLAQMPYDSLTYRKMLQVPNLINTCKLVDHENKYDTYDLIRNAGVVVTLNSQAGLEAALFGKPVICCAPANYSNLGFTIDCFSRSDLMPALEQALRLNNKELDKIASAASEYDYIFNEIYCIPKNINSLVDKVLST